MLALRLPGGLALPARGTSWRMAPVWMGREGPPYLFGADREWRTLTPFVTPLFTGRNGKPRPGRDVAGQLGRELALRGLPPPMALEVLPGAAPAAGWIGPRGAAHSHGDRIPPGDAVAAQLVVRFASPVRGPLALGFGAHFGLGLFGRGAAALPIGGAGKIVPESERVSRTLEN